MPDEAREVVFPTGIQVNLTRQAPGAAAPAHQPERPAIQPHLTTAEKQETEGTLTSESVELAQQAQHARIPEQGPNLLEKG